MKTTTTRFIQPNRNKKQHLCEKCPGGFQDAAAAGNFPIEGGIFHTDAGLESKKQHLYEKCPGGFQDAAAAGNLPIEGAFSIQMQDWNQKNSIMQ